MKLPSFISLPPFRIKYQPRAFLSLGFIVLALLSSVRPAAAVMVNNTTYQTTEPTSASISNWDTGWGQSGITGWDYVGTVGGASGVYLGNGWVITAAHVNLSSGTYTLNGVTYTIVAGSAVSSGSADITMFQISSEPDLPALSISSSALISFSTQVVMVGYGGGAKSWGVNTVTLTNSIVSVESGSKIYTTTDFITAYGTSTSRGRNPTTVTNTAEAVSGDSGGAAFTYNSSTGTWSLVGLMEANDANGDTYFIQLSSYYSFITSTLATVPEPSSLTLLSLAGLVTVGMAGRWIRKKP